MKRPALDQLPRGSHIAVVRLRSLGDCVLTTPALRLLKEARPDLRVGVVVEDRFRPVFTGNPDIEELLPPSLSRLFRWRPALTVNLHGGTRSSFLTLGSGASLRAGFVHFRWQPIYNVRIPRAQEILAEERAVHTAEHVASAVFHLGVPRSPIPRARLFARSPLAQRRPYAVLHPYASEPAKMWPAGSFRALADHLRHEMDLDPVFIGGPGETLGAFSGFERWEGQELEGIKDLLAGASLFAGNDSGPAHMAAAFGLPVLVFFGPSDRSVWAPWRTPSNVLHSAGGIGAISVREAIDAAEQLAAARQ